MFSLDLYTLSVITALLPYVYSHECYVCSNQTTNRGKCTQTVSICTFPEDACLTEVRWGTPPFWQVGVDMDYTISKRCITKEDCKREADEIMHLCSYITYEDWRCKTCCQGDRCNFYIIDAAVSHSVSTALLVLSGVCLAAAFLVW